MSGVWLSEPDPAAKRLDRARSLIAGPDRAEFQLDRLGRDLRALRRAAIGRLPELEHEACAAWSAAGLRVHVAAGAAEAVAIIQGIAGPTRHVAVNRSATASKEVAPALRAAGFAVSETYYQHLERASLSPRAFWQLPLLSDADVLGCFSRPREIVAARRRALAGGATRDAVGVLGVAAAAAADGSLFLLQHFHNAGDVFTLSKQVVLIVALDKLVPTAEDALLQTRCTALFGAEATLLDLAPAVPMPAGVAIESLAAAQGTDDVHVILLDNGRHRLAEGAYRDLLACIGCRACAVRCPTYRTYAGPQRWSPREYLLHYLQGRNPSIDLCVGCGMCLAQCPVQIDIPAMMLQAKAGRSRPRAAFLLANFEGVARLSGTAPGLSNALMSNPPFRRVIEPLVGLKAERAMPHFAGESFGRWLAKRRTLPRQERVAYYAGCTANYVEPAIGKATVALLERAGFEVRYPEQVCCGLPQMSNGRLQAARRNARRNIRSLLAAGCDVVTACTSCALVLKREYEHALGVEGAAALAARTYDIMEYAGRLRAAGRLPAPAARQRLSLLYHAPCHLRVRGPELVRSRVDLIAGLPGVQADLVDRGCCGMAGTFGCRREGYALSMAIGSPLFEAVRRAGPDALATDCPTCSMQLAQGTGLKPIHPVVLLWQAYDEEGGENRRELASVQGIPERRSGVAL